MKQKFKKAALTAAVVATSMSGMVMATAPMAHAGTGAECSNTGKKLSSYKGYITTSNLVNYSCNMRVKTTYTGKMKVNSLVSKGAWVKSNKSGYARWEMRQLNGKLICGGYVKPNSVWSSGVCNVKKNYTYNISVGSLSKLQRNSAYISTYYAK